MSIRQWYKVPMRAVLLVIALLVLGTTGAQQVNQPERVSVAGQWVAKPEVENQLNRLLEGYQNVVFSDAFRAQLQHQSSWQQQLTFALLNRYPDGPGTGSAQGPGSYIFETQLGAVIELAPAELAPRILMLAHCHESQLLGFDACFARHADALVHYHPENAVGYLVQAQRALENGAISDASQWMVQAGQKASIDFGAWRIVQVLFEVFGQTQLTIDDPLNLQEVGRFMLAEGSLAHLRSLPNIALNYPCQKASDEALLSGCLAAAKAMKLPGTVRMAHRIALAIEQNVYRRRGNDVELARLALELQTLPARNERANDIHWQMVKTGNAQSLLDAWVKFGELDTSVRLVPSGADKEQLRPFGLRRELANDQDVRLRCLPFVFPPGAPDCVTQEMMTAESHRLGDIMDALVSDEEFTQRLGRDPSVDAQLVLLQRSYHEARRLSSSAPPPLADLVTRFPAHPVANRLAAQWCGNDHLCLQDTAQRIITHEPTDAQGYLLSATAHLAANEVDQAIDMLDRLPMSTTSRGGFSLLAETTIAVLQRHLDPSVQVDPLGVWPIGYGITGIGNAAALALPAIGLSKYCKDPNLPLARACLNAGRGMTLPGASVIETQVGLEIMATVLERSGPSQELASVIDKMARLEALRDKMIPALDRLTFDPGFSQAYLEVLLRRGEMAAFYWLEQQPLLFDL